MISMECSKIQTCHKTNCKHVGSRLRFLKRWQHPGVFFLNNVMIGHRVIAHAMKCQITKWLRESDIATSRGVWVHDVIGGTLQRFRILKMEEAPVVKHFIKLSSRFSWTVIQIISVFTGAGKQVSHHLKLGGIIRCERRVWQGYCNARSGRLVPGGGTRLGMQVLQPGVTGQE